MTPPEGNVPSGPNVPISPGPFTRGPGLQGGIWLPIRNFVIGVLKFFWEIVVALADMLRATLMLFINTPPVLLPSVVHTSAAIPPTTSGCSTSSAPSAR